MLPFCKRKIITDIVGKQNLYQIFRDVDSVALDHDGVQELLHGVGVPLVNGERLRHLLVLIKQLEEIEFNKVITITGLLGLP